MHQTTVNVMLLSAFIFLLAFKVGLFGIQSFRCGSCNALFRNYYPAHRSQPSEPHLTRYLREVKGFSDDTINNDIYVVWTYAYLPFLLLCAPIASIIGDVNTIALGATCRLVTRALLLYGTETWHMIVMEIFYSGGSAAETVFFAYVYTVVPLPWHGTATAATQSAFLCSQLLSGILGDMMIHWMDASLQSTLWVSAVSVALGCASLAILPTPPETGQQVKGKPAPMHSAANSAGTPATCQGTDSAPYLEMGTPPPGTPVHHPGTRQEATSQAGPRSASGGGQNSTRGSDDCSANKDTTEMLQPDELSPVERVPPVGPFDGLARGWQLLLAAWTQPSYRSQAMLWVAGAAAWQFVFGWEASLYDAAFPNAKQDWNGSVLSAMLVFGAGGAAVVSYPAVQGHLSGTRPSGFVLPAVLAVVCSVVLAAVYWMSNGIAMLGVLVVVFFAWQLWNAGFYVVTARVVEDQGYQPARRAELGLSSNSRDSQTQADAQLEQPVADGGAAAHSHEVTVRDTESPVHAPLLAGDGHPTGVPPGALSQSSRYCDSENATALTGISQVFVVNQALGLVVQVILQSVLLTWVGLGLQPLYGACALVMLVGVLLGAADLARSQACPGGSRGRPKT